MKFKNVILIFALLFVQFCSLKIDFSTLAEVKEMNGDTYASNLIQTINTEVNAKGGKIESIQNLITELYNNLIKDQSHADGKHVNVTFKWQLIQIYASDKLSPRFGSDEKQRE